VRILKEREKVLEKKSWVILSQDERTKLKEKSGFVLLEGGQPAASESEAAGKKSRNSLFESNGRSGVPPRKRGETPRHTGTTQKSKLSVWLSRKTLEKKKQKGGNEGSTRTRGSSHPLRED